MSELGERFEKWWQQESTRFFAGHEVDGWMHTACKAAWMNGADVQKHGCDNAGDTMHLNWIFCRLVHKHGENPMVDYMQKFKQIVNKRSAKEQG
jgi:hypothetical protein